MGLPFKLVINVPKHVIDQVRADEALASQVGLLGQFANFVQTFTTTRSNEIKKEYIKNHGDGYPEEQQQAAADAGTFNELTRGASYAEFINALSDEQRKKFLQLNNASILDRAAAYEEFIEYLRNNLVRSESDGQHVVIEQTVVEHIIYTITQGLGSLAYISDRGLSNILINAASECHFTPSFSQVKIYTFSKFSDDYKEFKELNRIHIDLDGNQLQYYCYVSEDNCIEGKISKDEMGPEEFAFFEEAFVNDNFNELPEEAKQKFLNVLVSQHKIAGPTYEAKPFILKADGLIYSSAENAFFMRGNQGKEVNAADKEFLLGTSRVEFSIANDANQPYQANILSYQAEFNFDLDNPKQAKLLGLIKEQLKEEGCDIAEITPAAGETLVVNLAPSSKVIPWNKEEYQLGQSARKKLTHQQLFDSLLSDATEESIKNIFLDPILLNKLVTNISSKKALQIITQNKDNPGLRFINNCDAFKKLMERDYQNQKKSNLNSLTDGFAQLIETQRPMSDLTEEDIKDFLHLSLLDIENSARDIKDINIELYRSKSHYLPKKGEKTFFKLVCDKLANNQYSLETRVCFLQNLQKYNQPIAGVVIRQLNENLNYYNDLDANEAKTLITEHSDKHVQVLEKQWESTHYEKISSFGKWTQKFQNFLHSLPLLRNIVPAANKNLRHELTHKQLVLSLLNDTTEHSVNNIFGDKNLLDKLVGELTLKEAVDIIIYNKDQPKDVAKLIYKNQKIVELLVSAFRGEVLDITKAEDVSAAELTQAVSVFLNMAHQAKERAPEHFLEALKKIIIKNGSVDIYDENNRFVKRTPGSTNELKRHFRRLSPELYYWQNKLQGDELEDFYQELINTIMVETKNSKFSKAFDKPAHFLNIVREFNPEVFNVLADKLNIEQSFATTTAGIRLALMDNSINNIGKNEIEANLIPVDEKQQEDVAAASDKMKGAASKEEGGPSRDEKEVGMQQGSQIVEEPEEGERKAAHSDKQPEQQVIAAPQPSKRIKPPKQDVFVFPADIDLFLEQHPKFKKEYLQLTLPTDISRAHEEISTLITAAYVKDERLANNIIKVNATLCRLHAIFEDQERPDGFKNILVDNIIMHGKREIEWLISLQNPDIRAVQAFFIASLARYNPSIFEKVVNRLGLTLNNDVQEAELKIFAALSLLIAQNIKRINNYLGKPQLSVPINVNKENHSDNDHGQDSSSSSGSYSSEDTRASGHSPRSPILPDDFDLGNSSNASQLLKVKDVIVKDDSALAGLGGGWAKLFAKTANSQDDTLLNSSIEEDKSSGYTSSF